MASGSTVMKAESENDGVASDQERELARLFREGDRDAFTRLVSLYQKQIYKLAYRFFQDSDDAMEIVQETFMRLYEKSHKFRDAENPATFRFWVYRIAYNLCIDYYRKFKKKKAEDRDLFEQYERCGADDSNPEDLLLRRQYRDALNKSVMGLSGRQREVFILRHYSEMKHAEISGTLKISVGAVKTLYHRAVRTISHKLSGFGVQYE